MLCMCDPVSINRQFSVGFEAGFEVISWEPLAKATALLEEEWHHGIERGDSIQQACFWMTETVNDCLKAVWSQDNAFYYVKVPTFNHKMIFNSSTLFASKKYLHGII